MKKKLLMISACFIFLGCSQGSIEPKGTVEKNTTTYLYQGEIENLIKDKSLNKKSFLTLDNIDQFRSGFYFTSESFLQFRKEKKPKTLKQVKEENKAPEIRKLEDLVNRDWPVKVRDVKPEDTMLRAHKFDLVIDGFWTDGAPLVFNLFLEEDGTLSIKQESYAGYTHETVNYSQNVENHLFSALVSWKEIGSKDIDSIYAYYFRKHPDKFIEPELEDNDRFVYLNGKAHRLRWEPGSEVVLSICGETAGLMAPIIIQAIEEWSEIVKPYFNLSYDILKAPPPYNSVDVNCIYMEDFVYLKRLYKKGLGDAGYALMHRNYFNNTLFAGHIFVNAQLNRSHYESMNSLSKRYLRVFRHEIGHFLGLDHNFEGEVSLMDYNFEIYEIQDYDREAIDYLYSDVKKPEKNELTLNQDPRMK